MNPIRFKADFRRFALLAAAIAALHFPAVRPQSEPLIRFLSPPLGRIVYGKTLIAVTITAPDKDVEKIEFYVDGLLVDTVSDSPYETWFDFKKDPRNHRIKAVLYLQGREEPWSNAIYTQGYAFSEHVEVHGLAQREYRFQALVRDKKNNPVRNLELSDFQVSIQGRDCVDARDWMDLYEQEGDDARRRLELIEKSDCIITHFANPEQLQEQPKAIAVVLDISGSMAEREKDGSMPLERLLELGGFVQQGLDEIFNPRDQYIFARFATVMYDEGPTSNTDDLMKVILRPYDPEWGDSTPYYAAVRIITDRLKNFRESPKAILIFSDCMPYDHIDAELDRIGREMDNTIHHSIQMALQSLKQQLLEEKRRLMDTTLDYTLEIGVPVYNAHFPGENDSHAASQEVSLRNESKVECHRWILKTGGNILYLGHPETDIKKALREIKEDTDSSYLFSVRHDKFRSAPKIRVKRHPDWKVESPRTFMSFKSSVKSIQFKLAMGTPEERLEAAYFARRFGKTEIRDTLRSRVFMERFPTIKETVVESLLAISLPEICSKRKKFRERALSDVNILYSDLDGTQKRILLDHDPETCIRYGEFGEALLFWRTAEQDTEIGETIYFLCLQTILHDLKNQKVSLALRRAVDLGGSGVEHLLKQYLLDTDLDLKTERKIMSALGEIPPS
ncbi:MAG: Ig-like domain-containing protein [Acidobacteriota bacterium]